MKAKITTLIPNLLTFSRFPAAYFIFQFAADQLWLSAFLLIIWCFLSDIADGLLARKLKVTTKVGHIADMVSDVLVDVAMIWGLCANNIVPIPFAILLSMTAAFIRIQSIAKAPPMSWAARAAAKIMIVNSPIMLFWIFGSFTLKVMGTKGALIMIAVAIPISIIFYLLEKPKINLWFRQAFGK